MSLKVVKLSISSETQLSLTSFQKLGKIGYFSQKSAPQMLFPSFKFPPFSHDLKSRRIPTLAGESLQTCKTL